MATSIPLTTAFSSARRMNGESDEPISQYSQAEETAADRSLIEGMHTQERPTIQRRQGHLHLQPFLKVPISCSERQHVHDLHGEDSWQSRVLHFIHSPIVTYTLMGLLLLDVIILFAELFLNAEFPECRLIERDAISCCPAENVGDENGEHFRFLSAEEGDHNYCDLGYPGEYQSGCDPHKYPGVHTAHEILEWMTMFILSVFLIELLVLIVVCGPRAFFSKFFYCLDLFIILGSMALEVAYMIMGAAQLELMLGFLLLGRFWRFVRIGHGIFEATYEISMLQQHNKEEYTRKLEELCLENGLDLPKLEE